MIKNDINLIQKRKGKQYSSKSIVLTIGVIVIVGLGVFLGITLPSNNLAQTKATIANLDDQLQMFNIAAISESSGEATDTEEPTEVSLDTVYVQKSKTLSSLNDQLESLNLIASTESNALMYINAIEESLPTDVILSSLSMEEDKLEINGTAISDKALATFSLNLRRSNMFTDVFVTYSMIEIAGSKTAIFNVTAILNESLSNRPDSGNNDEGQSENDTTAEVTQ